MNTIMRIQNGFWGKFLGSYVVLALMLMTFTSLAIAVEVKPISKDVTYNKWQLIKRDGDWHVQDPAQKDIVFSVPFRARINNCDGSSMLLKDYLLNTKANVIIRYDDKGVGVVREIFILCE